MYVSFRCVKKNSYENCLLITRTRSVLSLSFHVCKAFVCYNLINQNPQKVIVVVVLVIHLLKVVYRLGVVYLLWVVSRLGLVNLFWGVLTWERPDAKHLVPQRRHE